MFRRSHKVSQIPIPQIPFAIAFQDFKDNFKLYSDFDIHFLRKVLLLNPLYPDKRYNKKELENLGFSHPEFGVIKDHGKLYAIYYGLKKNSELGFGSYGKIKAIQELESGQFGVIKIIRLFTLDELWHAKEDYVKAFREDGFNESVIEAYLKDLYQKKREDIDINKNLQSVAEQECFNLQKRKKMLFYFDYTSTRNRPSEEIKNRAHILGMEFAQGQQLFTYEENLSHSKWPLSPLQHLKIAMNIIEEAELFFKDKLLHRDIKPENVMVDSMQHTKLIDYGFVVSLPKNKKEYISKKIVGTPVFIANEIIERTPITYSEASEIFALGMLIADHYGLTKHAADIDVYNRYRIVDEKENAFIKNAYLPKEMHLRTKILKMLKRIDHHDPNRRPTYKEMKAFFKRSYEAASKNEKINVCMVSVEEILNAKDKDALIVTLRAANINSVALFDREDRGQFAYVEVHRVLQNKGVASIALNVFIGVNNKALETAVSQYYQNEFQVRPTLHRYENQAVVAISKSSQCTRFGFFRFFSRSSQYAEQDLLLLPADSVAPRYYETNKQ